MADPILEIRGLRKVFDGGRPGLFQRASRQVRAVDGVDLTLNRSEVLALVGESGCGKSTLGLLLMGLEDANEGQILFEGRDITFLTEDQRRQVRRRIQMIFQDPYESLNPTQTIEEIISEPMHVHGIGGSPADRRQRVCAALEDAGLKPAETYLQRYPHELSGGQRQRVVVAAALVLEPELLIADEPVSMLDVSIRAEILNLLADLRHTRKIAVLFITHDIGSAGFFADRAAVMYLGRIVELGAMRSVLASPKHPYTQALLSVVPVPNPRLRHEHIILQGETPNPVNIPSGCRFHTRCPIAKDICKQQEPLWREVADGHFSACHLL